MRQNTPLKAKSNLKAKTSLKAAAPLRANVGDKPIRRPASKKTLLKRNATKIHSRYVRLRDSEWRQDKNQDGWYGKCITCSHTGLVAWIDDKGKLRFTRGWDAGHYIPRGNWFLRHHEENVNLQCSYHCNKMKSGNLEKYKPALDAKYGEGTVARLDAEARANPSHNPTISELEEVIHNSKTAIDFMLSTC